MSNRRPYYNNPFARDFSYPKPTPRPRQLPPTTSRDEDYKPTPSRITLPMIAASTSSGTQTSSTPQLNSSFQMNIDKNLYSHIHPNIINSTRPAKHQIVPPTGPSIDNQASSSANVTNAQTTTAELSSFDNKTMYSSSDLVPYDLPIELAFGKLRSTTEFSRQEQLGDSNTCRVFKARDIKQKKIVAMKFIDQYDKNGTLKKDIFREITLLRTLEHANIIKLIDIVIGSEIDSLCLIFEYCPISVAKFIDRYPKNSQITLSEIKCILKHLLKGLYYLHNNFIIHRDIKTSNLVITRDGIVKIIDFGISRRYTNTSYGTPLTPNVCTRWYQAPEILLQSPTYDEKIDMWSVGCILGELLFKKPLLPGNSEIHQINIMIDLLGSPSPNNWPGFTKCKIPKSLQIKKQNLNKLEEKLLEIERTTELLDLLCGFLQYDPCKRTSALEALEDDQMQKSPRPLEAIDLTLYFKIQ